MDDELVENVKRALSEAPKRNFLESVDLAMNLKNIDMSQPANRVDLEVVLPNGLGKELRIGVFAKGETALRAREAGADVIDPAEIAELAADKKRARALARQYDIFIAEAQYMPQIGKAMGALLAPRGKMPTPLTPDKDVVELIDRLKRSVRVRSKDKTTFHVSVGRANMEPEAIAENIDAVLSKLEAALPRGAQNIRSVYVSTTMGPSVRVM
ncbi:50S ribosomal protein L1 [Methermicoccus shengliensis]|uniref:Large ribosomal subunit protein uL1 n=1 Tax=Methermicoccus shengliensis TaxID=660064 RepID=A0A832VZD3_9EURY|nr:50S ribosomal protein L1 [Methermicoccus shengliensis]KUK05009.1 MAG: 50S ribosomal protein L1 [Euryarchaeota archaeon 55_53]KUK30219.1 MAG: 50S ribosomal protein L1 [Methanosarcinales archeaon 56_1174]MDI3487607.1 large subunit ribosomal protein [Methanosarcinales archaeon]MDN5294756.1 large subunit ribosomal protein [Methanosarcinales archaeon]HIH69469.1 50S ribosomal protein L1 [Methermicoccus shengliensis]